MKFINVIKIYFKKIKHTLITNIYLKKFFTLISKGFSLIKGFIVPALLVILIILPAIISSIGESTNKIIYDAPVKALKGDLQKTIRSTAKIEYEYEYSVKSYQNVLVTDVLVKEGDFVKNGKVLATLDPIGTYSKIRTTELDNQLNSINQELANLNLNKENNIKINNKNIDQLNKQLVNLNDQITDIQVKVEDIIGVGRVSFLESEIDLLEDNYDNLTIDVEINDSILQLEAELDAKESQLDALKSSVTSLSSSVSSLVASRSSALAQEPCLSSPDGADCEDILDVIESSLFDVENRLQKTRTSRNELEAEIDELELQVEELKDTDRRYIYDPITGVVMSDSTISSSAQREIAELGGDITELKALRDQLKTLERSRDELSINISVQSLNLEQSITGIDQSIKGTQIQIQNLLNSKNDLIIDLAKQRETEVLLARRPGIVSKINYMVEDEIPLGSDGIDIVSENKVIRFELNAENRSIISEGMSVYITNPDNEVEKNKSLEINSISISPITKSSGLSTTDEAKYEVEIKVPKEDGWFVGKSIDVDVVIDEKFNITYVPATAVYESKLFVAKGGNEVDSKFIFDFIEDAEVITGLQNGRYTEIVSGLNENDYVFSIYPRTEVQKKSILEQFLKNNVGK